MGEVQAIGNLTHDQQGDGDWERLKLGAIVVQQTTQCVPSHQLHDQEPGLSQRLIADATEVPSLDDVWVLHAAENPRFVG